MNAQPDAFIADIFGSPAIKPPSRLSSVTMRNVDRVISGEADNLDDCNDIFLTPSRDYVFNRYNNRRMALVDAGEFAGLPNDERFRRNLFVTGCLMAADLVAAGYR